MSKDYSNIVHISERTERDITIYITDEITSPHNYTDALQTLKQASPEDTVSIYINSCGGRVDTMLQFADAIKHCEAIVTGYIVGEAQSAASVIFLACDAFYVSDLSFMMIHTGSYGSWGKGNDVLNHAIHHTDWLEKIAIQSFTGFLTEDEINAVIHTNKEIYLSSEDINKRLKNLVKYRESPKKK